MFSKPGIILFLVELSKFFTQINALVIKKAQNL